MLRTLLAQQGRCLTPAQWEFVAPRVAEEPTALYVRLALRTVGELMSWASDAGVTCSHRFHVCILACR